MYQPDGVTLTLTSGYDCPSWLQSFSDSAHRIDTELARAGEQARQAGVYPGVLREARRKARLDWPGWDR